MARSSKYTKARVAKILKGLRDGMTRRAASSLGGICEDTFSNWLREHSDFSEQVAQAEQEAEARYVKVIAKAAFGHDAVRHRKTTRPVVVKFVDDNGRKQERVEHVTEETIERYKEYDWRAALEWLKRRKRKDWGDNVHVDVDREIAELLSELAGTGQDNAQG